MKKKILIFLLLLPYTSSFTVGFFSRKDFCTVSKFGDKPSLDSRLLNNKHPLDQIRQQLQTAQPSFVPKFLWSWVWNTNELLMTILDFWENKIAVRDAFADFARLWWKTIVGNRYLPLRQIMRISLSAFLLILPFVCFKIFLSRPLSKKLNSLSIEKSPLVSRLSDLNLLNQVSKTLSIAPPWNAPKFVWAWAWKLHKFSLPILHFWDKCAPQDTCVNLAVLWWKAIVGNRWGSKQFDGGVAHDLLPAFTRNIVAFPLAWLYPNLHHQNVALRTAYLDEKISEEVGRVGSKSVFVVVLGAGFDTRSLRLSTSFPSASWFELDLPDVVQQKRRMLDRFQMRRPKYPSKKIPNIFEANLNDGTRVEQVLCELLQDEKTRPEHVVFVSEAVLLYLDENNVEPLLKQCVDTARKYCGDANVSYCFADRFPGVVPERSDDEEEEVRARAFLGAIGLQLVAWQMKPGKARHMGVARLLV